ncbi:MAG: hypothetical protein HY744_29970 [Deltaproteobacteria bacterium]|nr:hypothetical protein [Deltaproteobacteria bacterium]
MRAAWAAAVAALVVARVSWAAGPLGKQGQPIQTSEYTIDLYDGPVLAGSRVVGLAGAYTPIAEGVAGYSYNPAAVAQRLPWSAGWFDWDLDGGFTLPASVTDFDYDNNGDESYANSAAFFATGGGGLQLGRFALGANIDVQQYRVGSKVAADRTLVVNVTRTLLLLGCALLDGELVLGLGAGINDVGVEHTWDVPEAERQIAKVTGGSAHAGAIWAPAYLPLRAGAAVRWGAQQSDSLPECNAAAGCVQKDGAYVSSGYYLPRSLALPTEIQAGVAFQLLRPLNWRWTNPHGERGSFYALARTRAQEARRARAAAAERAIAGAKRGGKSEDAIDALEDRLEEQDDQAAQAEDADLDRAGEQDRSRRLLGYRLMPRAKLLVSAAVKITMATADGVGLESFLEQKVERSGEEVTVQPRLGVEAEAIPGYVVVRAGGYLEPSRFREVEPRIHGTAGLDLRIPIEWSVFGLLDDDTTFRVSGALDATVRYFGWGAGLGLWH